MQGAGCRVQGVGCRMQGARCKVQVRGAGCRTQGSEFGASGIIGIRVWACGLRAQRDQGAAIRA